MVHQHFLKTFLSELNEMQDNSLLEMRRVLGHKTCTGTGKGNGRMFNQTWEATACLEQQVQVVGTAETWV